MKHLLTEQTGKVITVKCGSVIKNRDDATIWWSDVDCPACRPYQWVPDGPDMKKLVRVERKRRIVRTPNPLV